MSSLPPSLVREGPGVGASLREPSSLLLRNKEEAREVARTHPRPLLEGGRGAEKVAADFEALFVTQLLHAAHAAKLADDPLAGDDTSFRDLQDRTLAEALVRQSPLGVAKLLGAKR